MLRRLLFPRPETTLAGLDRVFLYIVLALRTIDVTKLIPAVLGTAGRSPQPALSLGLGTLFVVWSAVLIVIGLRDGSLGRRGWLVKVDVLISCVCLLAVLVITPPELRISQWDAWGRSVTYTSALFAGMALKRHRSRLLAALLLWVCAVIPTGFVSGHPDIVLIGWTNSLVYPAYTAVGWLVSDYFRRVAEATDEARRLATEAAARSAAEAEAARHRALLHDQATILDLVARGIEDPTLADSERRQAAVEARKVAAFMTEPPLTTAPAQDTDLASLARAVAHDFADLNPVVSVDLAEGTVVRASVATVVGSALTTLLHNVRRHAQSDLCVIHADADAGAWELTVRDDGVGFDRENSRIDYGLGELVERASTRAGLDVRVESAPGEGTTVTLRGGPETTVREERASGESMTGPKGRATLWSS